MVEWLRDHPVIYNKGLKSYKDSKSNRKLWDDQAVVMDMSGRNTITLFLEFLRCDVQCIFIVCAIYMLFTCYSHVIDMILTCHLLAMDMFST